jgi:hypothetical protein
MIGAPEQSNTSLKSELAHCYSAAEMVRQNQNNEIRQLQKQISSKQERHEFDVAVMRARIERMLHAEQHGPAPYPGFPIQVDAVSQLCSLLAGLQLEDDRVPMDLEDYEMVDARPLDSENFVDDLRHAARRSACIPRSLRVIRRQIAHSRGALARNPTTRAASREVRQITRMKTLDMRAATRIVRTSAVVGKSRAPRYTGCSSRRRNFRPFFTQPPFYPPY